MHRIHQTALAWRTLSCVLALAAAATVAGETTAEPKHVALQLSYYHQFQFAGYYAAEAKGFYRDEGIEVTIKELTPGSTPTQDVLAKRVTFGVSNNQLFHEWARGSDLFLMAVIYQCNQRVLIVRADSPYQRIEDIVTIPKNHLVGPAFAQEADLWASLKAIGQDPSTFFPRTKGPEDYQRFVTGDLWVLPGHLANEPLRLRRAGIPTRVLDSSPRKAVFPGDGLMCHGDLWRSDPDLVSRFRRASLAGWKYALSHHAEIVDNILASRPSRWQAQDRDHLLEEAGIVQELIDSDRFALGTIDPERMHNVAEVMRESGLSAQVPAGMFFVLPDHAQRRMLYLAATLAAVAAALVILMSIVRSQRRHLAESRAHYHRLVDLAQGYCAFRVHITPQRRVTLEQASPSIEPIVGHPLSHYQDDPGKLLDQIEPADRAALLQLWQEIDQGSDHPVRYRFQLRHPGHARPRHLMLHAVASRDADGIDLDGICLDLTAESEAEQQSRELQHQLQLAQRNESLGLLASGIAHDFNNILGAIRGNAELLTPIVERDEAGHRRLSRLLQGVDRAAGLVRQILAYTGRGSIECKPLDLGEETRQLEDLLRHTMPRGVAITLDIMAGLPPVDFDPAQFQQVLVNLIMNAAESYGGKPGTVHVSLALADRDHVRLEVADSGCGMDEAVRAHLFEPYFTTKATGHGLGLAAVQGIVSQADGTIVCESAPGKGTCFTIVLPCHEVPQERLAQDPSTAVRFANKRILVVDDDELMRELTHEMLVALGYVCDTASGGLAGERMLSERRADFSAMILDCRMPDLDGVTLLRRLRATGDRLPIVLVSGMTKGDNLADELSDVRTRFMAKPFTKANLQNVLDVLLHAKKSTISDDSSYALLALNATKKDPE
ncbi:MAG: ABC transporter substrate-binding protein [Planctomycetes bacterium]|nr:ABC transporter substrate-binding protein [Planctomycetota bacterium]